MRPALLVLLAVSLVGCDAALRAPKEVSTATEVVDASSAPEPGAGEAGRAAALPAGAAAAGEDAPALPSARSQGTEGKLGKVGLAAFPDEVPAKSARVEGLGTKREVARSGGLDTGISNALGGLAGSSAGAASGSGGLGTRGVGSGGGGSAVGLGGLGASGHGRGASGLRGGSGPRGSRRGAVMATPRRVVLDALELGGEGGASFAGRQTPELNAPVETARDRLSTFAIDVDTAAYSIARRTILGGLAPEPSLVRVEELINYFRYNYDPPTTAPFSVSASGAVSPVDEGKRLLAIGVQAQVVRDEDRLPANLVFLVDTSCSMTSDDRLGLAKESLLIALDHLTDRDSVAISTYAGGVTLVLPPTSVRERGRIVRAIRSLAPGGGTAMESGLTLAYQQAARMLRDGSITRIIVCSDGDANIGATSHEAMLDRVRSYVSEGVRISTIGFGDGNYRDDMMEQLADRGNGNYFYVDDRRQAERVFGRDLTKMLQDVAEDVKIQVELDPELVQTYRLVGYENRDVADADFRNDRVDAGEIGAGHQVTAIYELSLTEAGVTLGRSDRALGTIRVRAKRPRGMKAEETVLPVALAAVNRPFSSAPADLRFATAVMAAAELFRQSPHATGWSYDRVASIAEEAGEGDPDRRELVDLVRRAKRISREAASRN